VSRTRNLSVTSPILYHQTTAPTGYVCHEHKLHHMTTASPQTLVQYITRSSAVADRPRVRHVVKNFANGFSVKYRRDLEIWVRGRSRSHKMAQIGRSQLLCTDLPYIIRLTIDLPW